MNLGGFYGEQSIVKATGMWSLWWFFKPQGSKFSDQVSLNIIKKPVSSNFSVIKPLPLSVRWTVDGKVTSKNLGLFQLKKLRCLNVLDIKNGKKAMEKVIGRCFFFPPYT